MEYRADERDVKFNLFEWLDLDRLLRAGAFSDFGRDDLSMVLDEALKVSKGALASSNDEGDRVGARYEGGRVTMPPGFHRAYQDMASGGWIGATASPEFGGMGLPECVGTGINEFIMGANTALSLTLLLGRGSSHLIENFGTDEMKRLYCEAMYTGRWAGTMCLTEASAGSDLGDVKTRATKAGDGTYKIQGEKIFITSGEHDLTENIIHAVLARTPEAPSGPRGLSLFVVPKIRVKPDGTLGEPNDVRCEKIEHKMGIHGSPTCVLLFGGNGACEGYLLGRERLGLLLMFQMMNSARYEVGLQGLAIASAAYHAALAYSRQRLQGRHHLNREPKAPQIPIVEHPDMRRSLLMQSSLVQAMRALLSYTAFCLDIAKVGEGEEKAKYQGFVEVLTPICKAWCSDRGLEVASSAMQCYGGYGYTAEFPAEQYLRDARIAPIYEGTNAIQALDLVGRKFRMNGGEPVKLLLAAAGQTAKELAGDPLLGPSAKALGGCLKEIAALAAEAESRPGAQLLSLLNAVPTLEIFGDTLAGHLLLEQAGLAKGKLQAILEAKGAACASGDALFSLLRDDAEARFYHNKIQAARFYGSRILPQVFARSAAIRDADLSPMEAVF